MEFQSSKTLRGRGLHSVSEHTSRTRTYGSGRVCVIDGCDTLLSAYNPSSVCALHGGSWQVNYRHTTRKTRHREELPRSCAYEPCGHEFVTANPAKKYCSDACRMKAFQARVMSARRMEVDAAELQHVRRAS